MGQPDCRFFFVVLKHKYLKRENIMPAPQKISDNLKPVSNRGGGSKSASTVETISTQTLDVKPPVKVATTTNITLSSTQTIDGVSLSVGDRVLVKDQTSASENGIYIVQSSSWVRSNDANSDSKVNSGMIVFVKEGSVNLDQIFVLTTDGNISLDTTNLDFKSLTKDIGVAKEPVKVSTTENITLSGTQTIDGISLSVNDRILVKNQTNGSNNGIYTVLSGSWARSDDFDSNSKVASGILVYVKEGSINGDSAFILTSDNPINLGSTSLVFEKLLNISTQIIAGSGINLSYDSGVDTLEFSVKLNSSAPSSSTDTGSAGEIRYDSSYLYICVGTNTWRRVSHSSW